jgi:hypothetical protein
MIRTGEDFLEEEVKRLCAAIANGYSQRFLFSHGKKRRFYEFVKNNMNSLEFEKFPGRELFFQSRNICSKAKEYDVVLMAHYDTPPRSPFMNTDENPGILQVNWRDFDAWFIFGMGALFGVWALRVFQKIVSDCVPHLHLTMEKYASSLFFGAVFLFIYLFYLRPNPCNMNDNTSGVIAVLAAVKLIAVHEPDLLKRIKVVLTDNEEYFSCGALKIHHELPEIKDKLIINFDSVGCGDYLYLQASGRSKADYEKIVLHYLKQYKIIKTQLHVKTDYTVFEEYNCLSFTFMNKNESNGRYYIAKIHTPQDTCIQTEQLARFAADIAFFLLDYLTVLPDKE